MHSGRLTKTGILAPTRHTSIPPAPSPKNTKVKKKESTDDLSALLNSVNIKDIDDDDDDDDDEGGNQEEDHTQMDSYVSNQHSGEKRFCSLYLYPI